MFRHFEQAIKNACNVFGVPNLFAEQREAIKAFVVDRKDALLNLPTGFGKSLVYQMAPLVYSHAGIGATSVSSPIIVVISPLVSLMEDQRTKLQSLNIPVGILGRDEMDNRRIEKGQCSIVLSSPESILGNPRYRQMLSGDIYQSNLIGIVVDEAHCISHWLEVISLIYKETELGSCIFKFKIYTSHDQNCANVIRRY